MARAARKPKGGEQAAEAARLSKSSFDARRIERALVLADSRKREVGALLPQLERFLAERLRDVGVEGDVRAFYKRWHAQGKKPHGGAYPDLVVVLGGDGAILAAVRAFSEHPVPTLGINFGRVGFLACAEAAQWRETLEEILESRAAVEPRMRIEAALYAGSAPRVRAVALNDVVVSRGAHQGMITLKLSVDDAWVSNYRADGLILATPSGSTAHSLAAGGPILAPSMQGLVVTPICPQALSHRPIVLHPDSAVTLELAHAMGVTTLVVDGQEHYPLHAGEHVLVRRHPVPYPILARRGLDPYKRLRDRLGWRGNVGPDAWTIEPGEPDDERELGGVL
jgi:NAD+ kinase